MKISIASIEIKEDGLNIVIILKLWEIQETSQNINE